MGEAISSQHPAVVLRSQFNLLRALLAVAMVAVAGLSVAVVILATDDDAGSTSAAKPVESINYGNSNVNPSTGYPTVPLSQLERPLQSRIDGIRYNGGPEEGTRGVDLAPQANARSGVEAKHEAATAAAIGQANSSSATETKDEAATAAAIGQE
jgi:hypothetical protein